MKRKKPRRILRVRPGLYVRRDQEYVRTPEGVVHPAMFDGSDLNAFLDRKANLLLGRNLVRERGVTFIESLPHPDYDHLSEQWCAADHAKWCKILDRSPAGRKATELLLSVLDPIHAYQAERFRAFEVCLYNPYQVADDLRWGYRDVQFPVARFRFQRGFPNGNINFKREEKPNWEYTVCLHPIEPYPTDDIVLAQYMLLMDDPDEFIRQGNLTRYGTNDRIKFEGMFVKEQPRARLILP